MTELLTFIKNNSIDMLADCPMHIKIDKLQDNMYRLTNTPGLSRMSIPLVREANNIIVSNDKIVCGAYPFMYDYESCYAPSIKYSESIAREYIDGHICKLYYYNGKWRKDSELSNTDFLDNINTDILNPNYTYIFKYVCPELRIITPYTETKLYLIEVFSNAEQRYVNNIEVLYKNGVPVEKPKTYKGNNTEYTEKLLKFDKNVAGLVIKDNSGQMLRMLTSYYKTMRHSLNQDDSIHTISIIRAICLGEQDWYLNKFPDDKKNMQLVEDCFKKVDDKIDKAIQHCKKYKCLEKSALIDKAVSLYGPEEISFAHLYATLYDKGCTKEVAYKSYSSKYVKSCFRLYNFPVLYKPTTKDNLTIIVDKNEYPLAIQEFILKHPSNWDELLSEYVNVNTIGPLTIFKYNQLNADFSLDIVKESRGLILDNNTFKVVRIAFDKFFNYGEYDADDIDWASSEATEKIDGSLISLYYYDNKWCIATNGTINAYNTDLSKYSTIDCPYKTFGNLAAAAFKEANLDFDRLNKNNTYTFELVSPYNKVVIDYDKIDIYHILTRSNITLEEVNEDIGIKKPKTYNLKNTDPREFTDFVSKMGNNSEGIVVKDKFNHRVKIKTQHWMNKHYSLNNNVLSFTKIVDIILSGETEEAMISFPNYKNVFLKMLKQIDEVNQRLAEIADEITADKENGLTRRDIALKYKSHKDFTFYINTFNNSISSFTDGSNRQRFLATYKLKDIMENMNKGN